VDKSLGRCRSCHRQVRWAQTADGKNMPLDVFPSPDGSILLIANGRCRVVPEAMRATCVAPLFKSHFATCPNAAAHRSKR
jgi:hypothetical protein